jgi:hypothetical protein
MMIIDNLPDIISEFIAILRVFVFDEWFII